jgi:hypothetical protein
MSRRPPRVPLTGAACALAAIIANASGPARTFNIIRVLPCLKCRNKGTSLSWIGTFDCYAVGARRSRNTTVSPSPSSRSDLRPDFLPIMKKAYAACALAGASSSFICECNTLRDTTGDRLPDLIQGDARRVWNSMPSGVPALARRALSWLVAYAACRMRRSMAGCLTFPATCGVTHSRWHSADEAPVS